MEYDLSGTIINVELNETKLKVVEANKSIEDSVECLHEAITNLGVENIINVLKINNESKRLWSEIKDIESNLRLKITTFDDKFQKLSHDLHKNISFLTKIKKNIYTIEIALETKKIIQYFKSDLDRYDIQLIMSTLNNIELILQNLTFKIKMQSHDEMEQLSEIKENIFIFITNLFKTTLNSKGNSINDIVYILITEKSFENKLIDIFNQELMNFNMFVVDSLYSGYWDDLNKLVTKFLDLLDKLNQIDSTILKLDKFYFEQNGINQTYIQYILEKLTVKFNSIYIKIDNDTPVLQTLIETNYLKYLLLLHKMDSHINNYESINCINLSSKNKLKSAFSNLFELNYLNNFSKKFNNLLYDIFDPSCSKNSLINDLQNILDYIFEQLHRSYSIDHNLCISIYDRFFQFIDVLCSRIEKIKLTDRIFIDTNINGQKSSISDIYIIITLISKFLYNKIDDKVDFYELINNTNQKSLNLCLNKRNHLKSLICDSLQLLLDLPVKILLSDYHQSPRFNFNKISVSHIIIEINNKLQNWSNIFKNLIIPNNNLQEKILIDFFRDLSSNIIEACVIVKLESLKHAEHLINDNLALIELCTLYCYNDDIISSHHEIIKLLKMKDINDISVYKEACLELIDKNLINYFIINNHTDYNIIKSEFLNTQDLYYWLRLHRSNSQREELITNLIKKHASSNTITEMLY